MKLINSIRRHAKSKRGQSLVEFTLALPLFFAGLYAIIEFSHLFYVRTTVQHALDEAARYMSTGQGQSVTDPNARLSAIQSKFCTNLVATGVDCPILSMDPGGPEQIVTITATVTKPLFTGMLRLVAPSFPTEVNMTVKTIYKNEPFISINP